MWRKKIEKNHEISEAEARVIFFGRYLNIFGWVLHL